MAVVDVAVVALMGVVAVIFLLHILTSVWVMRTPNAGRKMHFQCFFVAYFDQHFGLRTPNAGQNSHNGIKDQYSVHNLFPVNSSFYLYTLS